MEFSTSMNAMIFAMHLNLDFYQQCLERGLYEFLNILTRHKEVSFVEDMLVVG